MVETPGLEHPITIERNPLPVTVTVAGQVVAETRHALTLREGGYPAVRYVPREDVWIAHFERERCGFPSLFGAVTDRGAVAREGGMTACCATRRDSSRTRLHRSRDTASTAIAPPPIDLANEGLHGVQVEPIFRIPAKHVTSCVALPPPRKDRS